jgi:hypothetical protein
MLSWLFLPKCEVAHQWIRGSPLRFPASPYVKNSLFSPSPLVGEGKGEGERTVCTPTSILPRQGGGGLLVIFMVRGRPPGMGIM